MFFDLNNPIHVMAVVATFGLVLSLWLGVVLLWSIKHGAREKTIRERLQTEQPERELQMRSLRLWHDGREGVIQRPAHRGASLEQRFRQHLHRAGIEVHVRLLVGGTAAAVIFIFFLSLTAMHSPIPAMGAVAVTGVVAYVLLQSRIAKRVALFETQFVDSLDIAARSLRAGHPLVGAFRLIADEIPPPVGKLFAEICEAQELGLSIERAIREVSKSANHMDVNLFATSIAIQLRSGGNLADMMDRLAFVIRDRMKLSRRIRVLTAQTQYSKRILAALPIILFFLLNFLNPQYMQPLYSSATGKLLLLVATLGVVSGIWVMNRLSILNY